MENQENNNSMQDTQPAYVPLEPMTKINESPKKSKKLGVLISCLIVMLVILGIGAFVLRNQISTGDWATNMQKAVAQYDADSVVFNAKFKAIDMNTMLDIPSAEKIKADLASAKENLLKLRTDEQNILDLAEADPNPKNVFEIQIAVRAKYKPCYEARKAGTDLMAVGLGNAIAYADAFINLKKYEDEAPNFEALKNSSTQLMRQKDDNATIAAMDKAASSSALLQKYLEAANAATKTNYLTVNAKAYAMITQVFIDTSTAYKTHDVKLLNATNERFVEAGKLLNTVRGQSQTDSQKWFRENVMANYINAEKEMGKGEEACKVVSVTEAASKN